VRLIAAVTTGISTVFSLWLYAAYDRESALTGGPGFQFYEKVPLVAAARDQLRSWAWTGSAS